MRCLFVSLIFLLISACENNFGKNNSNDSHVFGNTLSQQNYKNHVVKCMSKKLNILSLHSKNLLDFMEIVGKTSSECRAKRTDIENFLKPLKTNSWGQE